MNMSKIETNINTMKSYSSSLNCDVNFSRMNSLKKRERNLAMTNKTRDFIQKICYKKTASIDMTRYGFINDSKMNPVNLMMKPLRAQLEKICGNPSGDAPVRKKTTLRKFRKKVKVSSRHRQVPSAQSSHPTDNPMAQKPKSALGPRSFYTHVRKVKIESDATSKTGKKKVTLVLPAKGKKK